MPKVNTDLVNLMIWNYMIEHGCHHSAYDFYHESRLSESDVMDADKKISRDCLIKMLVKGSRYASEMFGETYNIGGWGLLDAANRIGEEDWEDEKEDETISKTANRITDEHPLVENPFPLGTVVQFTGHEREGVSCQWHPTEDIIMTTAYAQEAFARYWHVDTKLEKWSAAIMKSSTVFSSAEQCPLITYAKWSQKNLDICSLGDTDFSLHLHNKESRLVAQTVLDSEVREICWTPRESEGANYLACATEGGEVYIFDCTIPARGLQKAVQQFEGYERVYDLSFLTSMPGNLLLNYQNSIKLHSAATEECLNTFNGHNDFIMGIQECPHEEAFASCSLDGTVKLWRLDRKNAIHTLVHDGGISMLRWSPNKHSLITLTETSVVTMWNVEQITKTKTIEGLSATFCEYSHSGNMVAVGCVKGNLRVWDSRSNDLVRTHIRQGTPTQCSELSWSGDDKKIAAIFVDGTMLVYDMRMQPL